MLFEFAVEPDLLADINNCRTIFDNFKPERGKLVSDVPRQWIREAYVAIQRIPHPVMRKTIKEHLKKLLSQSLNSNRGVAPWDKVGESWLEYVAGENKTYPFAAVLSGRAEKTPINTYAISELFINSPECWNYPVQKSVPRTAKDIVDTLIPLFRISKQVVLIDRHIYPGNSRSLKVLLEIIRRSSQFNYGKGISKIIIHSSDHRLDMQSSLEKHVLQHLPLGLEISCSLWPKSIEHDRFAITDVGGVSLGEGLDERTYDGTGEVLISLLDYASLKRLRSKFSGTPTYTASISK